MSMYLSVHMFWHLSLLCCCSRSSMSPAPTRPSDAINQPRTAIWDGVVSGNARDMRMRGTVRGVLTGDFTATRQNGVCETTAAISLRDLVRLSALSAPRWTLAIAFYIAIVAHCTDAMVGGSYEGRQSSAHARAQHAHNFGALPA